MPAGWPTRRCKWDPKFAPGWTLRGRVASAAGQLREMLADYQRLLAYAPDNHEAAILVAEVYRQLNEPERALLALRSVADNYSPHDEPQQLLYLEGLALTALGRYDEAVRSLTRAAQCDRPTAEILCRLAEAELLAGRTGAGKRASGSACAGSESRGQPDAVDADCPGRANGSYDHAVNRARPPSRHKRNNPPHRALCDASAARFWIGCRRPDFDLGLCAGLCSPCTSRGGPRPMPDKSNLRPRQPSQKCTHAKEP